MSDIQIIQGDCLEVMKGFDDKQFDLVLTDPPYGIFGGKKEIGGKNIVNPTIYSEMNWDLYPLNICQFDEMERVSENQVIFGWNYFSEMLPKCGCHIVWDKACQNGWDDNFADGELAWSSFKRPMKIYRLLWKGALRLEKEYKRTHPTQKPVNLMKWILKDFTNEGDTVLDPFLGSGTTAVACERMGRNCVGIEISPEYCEIARRRVQEEKDKMALFAGME